MHTGINRFMRRAAPLALVLCSYLNASVPDAGIRPFRATVPAGDGWRYLSDRENKENFRPVVATTVLDRLAAMPIQTWNYKTQPRTIRHIGPTAQDFMAAFHVGEDDRHINTVDAEGVNMAAIQGLYQRLSEANGVIAEQARRIDTLETKNAGLESRLKAVEARLGSPHAPAK